MIQFVDVIVDLQYGDCGSRGEMLVLTKKEKEFKRILELYLPKYIRRYGNQELNIRYSYSPESI